MKNSVKPMDSMKVIKEKQKAEVLSVQVKIKTALGEFLMDCPIPDGNPILNPGDAVDFTWTWNGVK